MGFALVVLDVMHREGEDNLVHATPQLNEELLLLRGMFAAAAGACRTLFLECVEHAMLKMHLHAGYVDQGDLLFVLLCMDEKYHANYLKSCAQRTVSVLNSVFGPPGIKLEKWDKTKLNSTCKALFRCFDAGLITLAMNQLNLRKERSMVDSVISFLFPRGIPSKHIDIDTMIRLHGHFSSPPPESCLGRVLFWQSYVVHSELDAPQTYLLAQWQIVFGNSEAPSTSMLHVDSQPHDLVRISIGHWSLYLLFPRHNGASASAIDAATSASRELLENVQKSIDVDENKHVYQAQWYHVVAFDRVGQAVLHRCQGIATAVHCRFVDEIERMRGDFDRSDALHRVVRSKVTVQPTKLPFPSEDPLLKIDSSVPTMDVALLSSRYSIFRPEATVCQSQTKQMICDEVDGTMIYIYGQRYAAWEFFACVEANEAAEALVDALWDELVSY
ncbi:hypothetical protein AeRB84_005665 [Aphanomyces euteiches]|nr:hypothetical protein AeRB84_005665 [Aphanomyces euteiches]